MRIFRYLFDRRSSALRPLSKAEYDADLRGIVVGELSNGLALRDGDKAARAFEKAWAIRNFEIEMYWRRATYFWAFIASTFVGYFALVNSNGYQREDRFHHAEAYFLICIGFLLSLAWFLTNKGSKQWQRHWEAHVDLLEDDFTGPLYKTVNPELTFSVSKINEIVSLAFAFVWALLGAKYLADQKLLNWAGTANPFIWVASIGTAFFAIAMGFGYGRGRFGTRHVTMYRRDVQYEGPTKVARSPNGENEPE